MKVANFGPLQGLSNLRPEDYVNYLQMLSAQNTRVSKPQFHAAISAKGKSYDNQALTAIAEEWLNLMGYAEQPYLIVYHKDTVNNHVHVVTTRVDRNGRKISSAFEHNRAIQNLNKVLGLDEERSVSKDMEKALAYNFGTKAQYLMILEGMGYKVREADGKFQVIKFGKQLSEIPLAAVLDKAKHHQPDQDRRAQLKAIFHKYSLLYSIALVIPELSAGTAFTSAFADYLKSKMGVELIFHAKDGKQPYGYTILDHAAKTVWKGGEIMPLAEMLGGQANGKALGAGDVVPKPKMVFKVSADVKSYYGTLLKAALHNYPDFRQGLQDLQLTVKETPKGWMLADKTIQVSIPVNVLLANAEMRGLELGTGSIADSVYVPPVSIADDVDDQQIHGMRRRRQRRARTNTR